MSYGYNRKGSDFFKDRVCRTFTLNFTKVEVLRIFNITENELDAILKTHLTPYLKNKGVCFWHKDEAYYSESEMMQGLPAYNYESLSETEKEMYNQIK